MVENYEGEDLNYNTAYQKVQEVNQVEMMVAAKSFELSILFLEEWKDVNPGSTVDWKVDQENSVEHVFICLHFAECVLQHLWPVIFVDGAHLKLCYKGTIYIYSGSTGTEEAYILVLASGEVMKLLFHGTFSIYNLLKHAHVSGLWRGAYIFEICICFRLRQSI